MSQAAKLLRTLTLVASTAMGCSAGGDTTTAVNQAGAGADAGNSTGGTTGGDNASSGAGSSGGSSSSGGAPTDETACEKIEFRADPNVPNVLVMLDRSWSMYNSTAGVDRWNPAVAAIAKVTDSLEAQIRFGLMLFPDPDAASGNSLCGAGKLDVAIGENNAEAVQAPLYGDPEQLVEGWTPTADSLIAAKGVLEGVEGSRYVLLITDGAPNCNGELDTGSCLCGAANPPCTNPKHCIDDDRTVKAIEDLAAAGIRTYVVGYDTTSWEDILNRMAVAGDTGNSTYFPVKDETSLETALTKIGSSLVTCTFELSAAPDNPQYVGVTIDGQAVLHESKHPDGTGNGYRIGGPDNRLVELVGSTCEQLKDGKVHDVVVRRECVILF